MIVLFFFIPFIAFIYCLRNLDDRKMALIFILFYGLFGYCQHFELRTADIYRKAISFELFDITRSVVTEYQEGASPDIYNLLMITIIRPFTSNPKVFVCALGLVFGLLCYNFYKYIYKNWTNPKRGLFYILVLLALSSISLVDFTGIRNATAGMLFLCSVYRYIYYGKKKWIIGILLSPLIHFQMWSYIIIFAIYLLTPLFVSRWDRFFKLALVAAFALSLINMSGMANDMLQDNRDDISNDAIVRKIDAYTDGEPDENAVTGSLYRTANQAFFNLFSYIKRLGMIAVMWLLMPYTKNKAFGESERKLYLFLLISSIFCIFFYGISYHLGHRLSNIWWELFFVFFAIFYSRSPNLPAKKLLKFMVFANFANIAYLFINAPRLVEPTFWLFPVPISIISGLNFSITGLF